ncbi:type III-B CRISPR module RAMP protein Cmr1 [Thermococcus henrietii]|uniref:type III-B CRISPR module RAMP protein Cmr1 n=1 Tax=Thermococcus henrietii TaxID=2016361 RepID=UPI000C087BBF|nr:type III-B CRISPR module RAMP protein Cmr1 [Thermococcus henrietii]
MYEATFELETITPLFMRGADQRKAEFRSASIKGVMRWWFRALAGSYFGNNIAKLREAECRVFGCAGGGGTRRSAVIVEVEPVESNGEYSPKNEYESYFWFSQTGRNSRGAVLPGLTLTITLEGRDEDSLKLAVLSLWTALHLGGFGSRSRKFGGSLFPKKEPGGDVNLDISFVPGQDVEEFYKGVFEGERNITSEFSKILRDMGFKPGPRYGRLPEYPVLNREHSLIVVGDPKGDVSEAIKDVGEWYLGTVGKGGKFEGGFRFKYANRRIPHKIHEKYQQGEERIGSIDVAPERRPFLGLPIPFYKSFGTESVKFTVDHWNADRRASCLLFTVNAVKSQNATEYYPVITLFRYKFLPGYEGPVRYRGGVYKGREKVANAAGALFIIERGQDGEVEYLKYLRELSLSLSTKFTPVYGSEEVFQ